MRFSSALGCFVSRKSVGAARRRLIVENMVLERRDVPALPTNLEQELLEWVNRFRMDPAGEYDRYISSTSPVQSPIPGVAGAVTGFGVTLSVLKSELAALPTVPPLAWNSNLNTAALGHNQMMIAKDSQQHVLPGESDIGTRIVAAGYTNWSTYGENIFAYASSVAYAQAGFVIDWGNGTDGMQSPRGHRNNLISGGFKELGISITPENDPATGVGPLVVTQDFGDRFNRTNSSVLGVVFTDTTNDRFYNAGEGNGGVALTLTGSAGSFTTTSWASGGYQFDNVPAGSYTLSIAGPGISTSYWTRTITVGAANVKSDFDLSQQPKSSVGFDTATEVSVKEGSSVTITLSRQGTINDALDVTITPKDIAGSSEIWQNLIQPLANGGVVHFDPNQATATFTVNTLVDNVIRADTHLNLKLTSSSVNFPVSVDTRSIYVLNNDQSVGFDDSAEQQVKAGGQVTVSLSRSGAVADPLDVLLKPADIPGSTEIWQNLLEILPNGGLLHFAAGQTKASMVVTAIQDGTLRADTHLQLQLTTTAANTNIIQDTKPLFVAHTVGTVGFESGNEIQLKEGGLAVLNLVRTGPTEVASDVDIQFVDQAGSTETWQNLLVPLSLGGRVHFNANDTQASIVVQAIQDKVIRADTKLSLKLTSASNIFNATTDTVPITVFNDDGTVGFESATQEQVREGGQLVVKLVRSDALTFPVDVKISPVNVGSGETWQNLIQPLANNGNIHFNAGQTTATFTVQTIEDNLVKPDSKVTLQLVSTSASILAGTAQKSLLVLNNDGRVGFDNATPLTLIEGEQQTLFLVRNGAVNEPLDVTVKPVNVANSPESWQNLIAPLANNGTIHFNPGQTMANLTLQAIQDSVIRPNTIFNLQLTSPSANWTTATSLKPIQVINDDTSIGFEAATEIQLNEGAQVLVNIVRNGSLTSPLDVKITPTDLAGATTSWQSLILPLANNGIIHFEPGQAVAAVTLQAIQDQVVRPDTRLNLVVSTDISTVQVTNATRSVFVKNDDVDTPGTFQFAAASINATASEAAGKAVLTITRSGGSLGQVVLPWTITQVAGPKLAAVKNTDIVFGPGVTSATIEIPIVNDKLAQVNPVFSIQLGTPKTAGATLGLAKTATLTVIDDDPKPQFTSLAGKRTKQQLTALDAIFSDKLNATTARSISIWKVVEAGIDGLFGTADDTTVALKTAAYNATAKKITLTFAKASKSATPLNYQVTLTASGLQNSYNAPLSGVITKTIKV